MKVLALFAVLALLTPSTSWADVVEVDGQWVGTYGSSSLQSEGDVSLLLYQNGPAVSGTMSFKNRTTGRGFDNVPVKGTVTGSKVSLRVGRQGQGWFEGSVSGTVMTGKTAGSDTLPANDFTVTKR